MADHIMRSEEPLTDTVSIFLSSEEVNEAREKSRRVYLIGTCISVLALLCLCAGNYLHPWFIWSFTLLCACQAIREILTWIKLGSVNKNKKDVIDQKLSKASMWVGLIFLALTLFSFYLSAIELGIMSVFVLGVLGFISFRPK